MRAAARDVRVSLDAVTSRTADGDGGYTDNYEDLSPKYAYVSIDIATANDLERRIGNTITASVSHLVTMPYHSGVNTKTRMTDTSDGTVYEVTGTPRVLGRKVTLLVPVNEVVA